MEFYINETKRTVKAKNRPIVIITSNAEKIVATSVPTFCQRINRSS